MKNLIRFFTALFTNTERLRIVLTVFSGITLAAGFFGKELFLPFDPSWFAVVFCGIPILLHAVRALWFEHDIKADTLVAAALIGALFTEDYFAAGEIAFIMQIGSILEDRTTARARRGIEKLMKLRPRTARIELNGETRIVPVEAVCAGDRLVVLAGETIPADGVILSGSTSVDQSSMTGESMPVDKTVGEEVAGGTLNVCGVFAMKVLRPESESFLHRVIRLTESADANKAKIVSRTDRWATWMVIAALAIALLTGLITREPIRAVTVLVVFCPCAFVLATPTAIMAGIGNATRHGVLVRSGDSLERFAGITDVAFDKTGTLTLGKPDVAACESVDARWSNDALFRVAASAESRSEHPLGRAIVEAARRRGVVIAPPDDFLMIPGRGIRAVVEKMTVLIGSEEFLRMEGITLDETTRKKLETLRDGGATALVISVDGKVAGALALRDTVRDSAKAAVEKIKALGMEPLLLTGDSRAVALRLAKEVGITRVEARLLPNEKLERIAALESKQKHVCMIGDGVNDAPALRAAYTGIALGSVGSDIAVESADAVLVGDDLAQVPYLLRIARKTLRVISANIVFSLVLNLLAVTLATLGLLNPVWGALIHNIGSIAVVLNSTFLYSIKNP